MTATCPHCGQPIDEGVATCPHCGRTIAPVPPVMPVQPPPRPAGPGGVAIAALVLGIIGVLFSFTIVLGFVLGGLAIVFGAVAMSRARTPGGGSKGMGVAGLVLGIVAIVFAVLMIVVLARVGSAVNDQSSHIQFCIDHPHDPSC